MYSRSICMFVLIAGLSTEAFGWGGKLNAPLIGYPSQADPDQVKKAQAALTFLREELKFIDGEFINTHVTHRFGGTSQQTSRCIELFDRVGAWKVNVRFKDFGEHDSALSIYQNIADNTLDLTVNSGRTDFKLSDFQAYLAGAK
jgi:hypothetical protein